MIRALVAGLVLALACDGPTVYLDQADAAPQLPIVSTGAEQDGNEGQNDPRQGDQDTGALDAGMGDDVNEGDTEMCEDCCTTSADCDEGDRALCDGVAETCVECLAVADCDDDELCTAQGSCEDRCDSDVDCSEEEPICHLAESFCVECEADLDCSDPSESVCNLDEWECDSP